MSRLNPEKLSVEFREGVTTTEPIIPRRYTLTHSDITAELFLTIGLNYAYDKTNVMRDEVLGEWIKIGEEYFYYVYLYVDGKLGEESTAIRNSVFRHELPLALEAIRYGDNIFFNSHPKLNYSSIIVYFMSTNPQFYKIENWGNFTGYNISRFYRYPEINPYLSRPHLLDMKTKDVTGDGVPDKVSLYASKGVFEDKFTVVIEDGLTKHQKTITFEFYSDYDAKLSLGYFTKNKIDDIKVRIDSDDSGGMLFNIYS